MPPLLVTLALDEASFAQLNAERLAYFPPERNHIPAHVTLFHNLPSEYEANIAGTLATAATQTPVLKMQATGLWLLGKGVAYALESSSLMELHAGLQRTFGPWLKPQDKQRFRPHVTIQNKVTPEAAKALYEQKQEDFVSFAMQGTRLILWRWLGGPWEKVKEWMFR